jgi:hypothetical protein
MTEKNTAQVNAGGGDDYELRWEIGTPPSYLTNGFKK